ncbi:Hypothetical protein NTJ_04603 [Nesidiocoris tenuis]|uniref:Uncharacterized protein n=1 Tax=Nesidiocoris tenuis TaxID=355587 RepID=A0ABN7AHQ5_9HEMI|nr:Hypothetical protein NTJ_04603 [Nesidiocoris tenuis]
MFFFNLPPQFCHNIAFCHNTCRPDFSASPALPLAVPTGFLARRQRRRLSGSARMKKLSTGSASCLPPDRPHHQSTGRLLAAEIDQTHGERGGGSYRRARAHPLLLLSPSDRIGRRKSSPPGPPGARVRISGAYRRAGLL